MKIKSGVLNYKSFITKQPGGICNGITAFLLSKKPDTFYHHFSLIINNTLFFSCSMNITGVLFLCLLDPASYRYA